MERGIEHSPPREVNKATLIATRLYPSKRLIIRYSQPHYPYLDLIVKGKSRITRKVMMQYFELKPQSIMPVAVLID